MSYNTAVVRPGDGVTTDFSLPFTYSDRREVVVRSYNSGAALPFTFISSNIIRLSMAASSGDQVMIFRITDLSSPVVFFGNGGINKDTLNAMVTQLLQGLQEVKDSPGQRGDTGAVGPKGDKGDQGLKGEMGSTGTPGPQGAKGDQGYTGPRGYDGPIGNKGDRGDQGPQGSQGVKGDTGSQGVQGNVGPKGDKGDKGDTGNAGASVIVRGKLNSTSDLPRPGNTADAYTVNGYLYTWTGIDYVNAGLLQGPKGDKGDQGIQGGQGIQGVKGDTGSSGNTGAQGNAGPKGDTGSPGPKGDTGSAGSQGIQGVKGDTGSQGVQGIKGDKGDTGSVNTTSDYTWTGSNTFARPSVKLTIQDQSTGNSTTSFIGDYADRGFLGRKNTTASAFGRVPANGDTMCLCWDHVGAVGTVTNTSWPGTPIWRNMLDDGYGNSNITGGLAAGGLSAATYLIGPGKTNGYLVMYGGAGGDTPGYIGFIRGDDVRAGYMGYNDGSKRLMLSMENGYGIRLTGRDIILDGPTYTAANYRVDTCPVVASWKWTTDVAMVDLSLPVGFAGFEITVLGRTQTTASSATFQARASTDGTTFDAGSNYTTSASANIGNGNSTETGFQLVYNADRTSVVRSILYPGGGPMNASEATNGNNACCTTTSAGDGGDYGYRITSGRYFASNARLKALRFINSDGSNIIGGTIIIRGIN